MILCQITSQATADSYAVSLASADFVSVGLRQASNVRPNRLFTADSAIVLYRAGTVTPAKLHEVIEKIIGIIRS